MADRPILTTSGVAKSGETVDVYCKLPHGLILRLFAETTVDVPVMGGGVKSAKEFIPMPDQVVLNGWAHKKEEAAACLIVNGFAVTHEVSKDFMDQWLEQNKEHSAVKAGLIFTAKRGDHGQAKEKADVKSGLEPLNQDSPTPGVRKFDGKKEAA